MTFSSSLQTKSVTQHIINHGTLNNNFSSLSWKNGYMYLIYLSLLDTEEGRATLHPTVGSTAMQFFLHLAIPELDSMH